VQAFGPDCQRRRGAAPDNNRTRSISAATEDYSPMRPRPSAQSVAAGRCGWIDVVRLCHIGLAFPILKTSDRLLALECRQLRRPAEPHTAFLGSLPAVLGPRFDQMPLERGEPGEDGDHLGAGAGAREGPIWGSRWRVFLLPPD
jgi:hypothetical protein